MKALKNLFKGFLFAFRGILTCVKSCRNFRIHIIATAYVLFFSRYYDFESTQYVLLFLTFGSVLSAEAFNSAIEYVCDAVTDKYNEKIKFAKDCSAGAVLISAVFAVCTAVALFANTDIILKIFNEFSTSVLNLALLVVSVIVSVIFIFYKEIFKNAK